ncbi:MAG: hypothetical protein JXR37_11780 [Kiritimatiellae bacterium]|nr:hypothetical protein [Kiritimatiellia bacterium]
MNRLRSEEGLSLIELGIAMLLLSIVMAGAFGLVFQAGRMNRMARNHYVAINIAKNRVERARNFEYSDLYLLAEAGLTVDENGSPAPEGGYRRATLVNTNYAERLTEMTVRVEIRDIGTGTFRGEEEVLNTLFTHYVEPEE